jgi:ABC-type phosphate/phosphonate transport system substrate-binding protein
MLALAAAPRPACAADKADKLEIRLASSLLTASRPSDAIAASMPMFEMISRGMSKPVPINFDIEPAHGMKELVAFAENVSKGKYQLGILWGLEYGWLKRHRGDLDLKPLTVVHAGSVSYDMLLLVADTSKNVTLANLKGKKLARFLRPSLAADFSLDSILRAEKLDPKDFFADDGKRYPTQQSAVAAVRDGEADCMITDIDSLLKLRSSQPGLTKHIVILHHGPYLPTAVAVGRPENLQKLRPGLWQEMATLL